MSNEERVITIPPLNDPVSTIELQECIVGAIGHKLLFEAGWPEFFYTAELVLGRDNPWVARLRMIVIAEFGEIK